MMMIPRKRNDFDLFEDMFSDPFFERKESRLMKTDIKEKKDKYIIDVDLPGYEKENIDIEIENGYLKVTAKATKDVDESDEDDSDYFDDPDPDAIIHQTTEKPIYVWEMGDSLTLDLSDMPNMDLANKVISKVYEAKADDGFFKVNIIYAGKLISAGFNVENLQVEEWNDFILSLLNKESILC